VVYGAKFDIHLKTRQIVDNRDYSEVSTTCDGQIAPQCRCASMSSRRDIAIGSRSIQNRSPD